MMLDALNIIYNFFKKEKHDLMSSPSFHKVTIADFDQIS